MDAESQEQSQGSIPQCCCGKSDCSFLLYNCTVLEGLERDVQTAAQLGQALLIRHESYIADAEQERTRMAHIIDQLEQDKKDLEARNAKTIKENRSLLDQLEGLNSAVAESDTQVKSLTAKLQSTQEELGRLTVLASRTTSLEKQLAQLEREQVQLQEALVLTREEEKTAMQRWRKAERIIADLHDQVDKIEKEAREERERHVEAVGRLERRRTVEEELRTSTGKLKGAAAARTLGHDQNGTNVVSHFVKDILQDNANLQMGIMELREMLLNSNEEVERLREQLMLHQPMDQLANRSQPPSLRAELGFEGFNGSEVHVHHHYHVPEERSKNRPGLQRKVKKKRVGVTSSHCAPPSGSHTSRSSFSKIRPATPSSSTTILSQTSTTIPHQRRSSNRWSIQSGQSGNSAAPSSVPSSPYSNAHRASSVFDQASSDAAMESSRPTSPESEDLGSPMAGPSSKRPPELGFRSFSTPLTVLQEKGTARGQENQNHGRLNQNNLSIDITAGHSVILEENEEEHDLDTPSLVSPAPDVSSANTTDIESPFTVSRPLRRATSHESLLSVSSAVMIPNSHLRPSRGFGPGNFLPASLFSPTNTMVSSKPVLSNMTAVATRPSVTDGLLSRDLLSGVAETSDAKPKQKNKDTLGKSFGGWIWGHWGATPAPPTLRTQTQVLSTPHPSRHPLLSIESVPPSHTVTPASRLQSATTVDGPRLVQNPSTHLNIPRPNIFISSASSPSSLTLRSFDGLRRAPIGFFPSSAPKKEKVVKPRLPGVNQSGPIFGLGPEPKVPFQVTVASLDEEALGDAPADE